MKVMGRVMLQALYSLSFLIEMAHDDVDVDVRGIYYQLGLLLLLLLLLGLLFYTIVVYYNAQLPVTCQV